MTDNKLTYILVLRGYTTACLITIHPSGHVSPKPTFNLNI